MPRVWRLASSERISSSGSQARRSSRAGNRPAQVRHPARGWFRLGAGQAPRSNGGVLHRAVRHPAKPPAPAGRPREPGLTRTGRSSTATTGLLTALLRRQGHTVKSYFSIQNRCMIDFEQYTSNVTKTEHHNDCHKNRSPECSLQADDWNYFLLRKRCLLLRRSVDLVLNAVDQPCTRVFVIYSD